MLVRPWASLCLRPPPHAPGYCCTRSPDLASDSSNTTGASTWESLPLAVISPDDHRTNPTLPGAIPSQLSLSLKTCPSHYVTSGSLITTGLFSHTLNSVSSYSSPPKPRWRKEGLGTELEPCQMTEPAFPTPVLILSCQG